MALLSLRNCVYKCDVGPNWHDGHETIIVHCPPYERHGGLEPNFKVNDGETHNTATNTLNYLTYKYLWHIYQCKKKKTKLLFHPVMPCSVLQINYTQHCSVDIPWNVAPYQYKMVANHTVNSLRYVETLRLAGLLMSWPRHSKAPWLLVRGGARQTGRHGRGARGRYTGLHGGTMGRLRRATSQPNYFRVVPQQKMLNIDA